MSSLAHAREEDLDEPSEITLSMASLLGIFFGLVLICGVFFGFGYSVGRRTADAAPMSASTAQPPLETAGTAADEQQNPPPTSSSTPDLSGQEAAPTETAPTEAAPADTSSGSVTLPVAPASTAQAPQALRTADEDTSPRYAAAAPAQPAEQAAVPRAAPVRIMVQIAAVGRREDADALLSALRKRGYNVVMRSEPGDKLLHVQVGPFDSRAQANTMKQKLLSDGYNAIVK